MVYELFHSSSIPHHFEMPAAIAPFLRCINISRDYSVWSQRRKCLIYSESPLIFTAERGEIAVIPTQIAVVPTELDREFLTFCSIFIFITLYRSKGVETA